MLEIEEEYGRPIHEVISDFRQDLTWKDIAACLGISRYGLLRWRKKLGLPVNRLDRLAYPPEYTPTDKKAQKLGYKDAKEAIFQLTFRQGKSREEVCNILHYCKSTFYCHYPEGKEYF